MLDAIGFTGASPSEVLELAARSSRATPRFPLLDHLCDELRHGPISMICWSPSRTLANIERQSGKVRV